MGAVASAGVGLSGLMRYRHARVLLRWSPPSRFGFHPRSLPSRCRGIYATDCHRHVEKLSAERGVQVGQMSMLH
jgi:hypothetical protein